MSLYGFRSPFLLWTLPACSFILFPLGSVAKTTGGALAPVTLHSEIAYSTARACAANCLVYNGIWQCGVNAGYQDLGVALQCGCQSINGCYCNTALGSSATSYISSCISKGCSKVDNWSVDLTSMLNLYDSYCATANVAVVEAQATTTIEGSASSPTVANAAKSSNIGQSAQTSGSIATGTASTSVQQTAAANEDAGLSKSDIVALAASLGVGIPSLLIAALTLYFQVRKKRRIAAISQAPVEIGAPQRNAYGVNAFGNTPSYFPGSSGSKAW
ncbi:hypothetical protein LY78DRAFT_91867 [Colletotrichum sublineola]|nr:hypothetical protein LY78DRAFT_91867 [Colletotrichum sublineola]